MRETMTDEQMKNNARRVVELMSEYFLGRRGNPGEQISKIKGFENLGRLIAAEKLQDSYAEGFYIPSSWC